MEDNKNIKIEQPTSTDENQPKKEKKRLPKKQRITIGIVMILIACATLILGIMIQVKGFDIFSNKASVGGDNIAYASSNDGAQVASVPNLPQGKNLYNTFDTFFTYYNNNIVPNIQSSVLANKISFFSNSNNGVGAVFRINTDIEKSYTVSATLSISNYICSYRQFFVNFVSYDKLGNVINSPNLVSTLSNSYFNYMSVYSGYANYNIANSSTDFTDVNISYSFKILSNDVKSVGVKIGYYEDEYQSGMDIINPQLELGSVATAYEPNYDSLIEYGALSNSYNPLKKGDVIQDLFFNFDKPIFDVKKVFPNYSSINIAPFDDFKYFVAGSFHTVHTRGFKLKLFNNVNNDIILNYWLNTDFSPTPDCFTIDIIIGGKQYISYFGSSGSTSLNASTIVFLPYDSYGTIPPELPIYQADNIHFSEPLILQADFPLSQQMCQGGLGVWLSANRHFYVDKNTIFNDGFDNGYGSGYTDGKKDGILEADSNNQNFGSLLLGIMDAPFKVFRDAFNFEIFGINVSALILFFITILCVSLVIKKLI